MTHTGMFSIQGFPCCKTWSLFPFRIRTLLCHRQSWRTCFVFVLTCHGVQRSTCLSRPQMRATSLIMATFVSGRKCVRRLLMTLWDHKHALSLHRYTLASFCIHMQAFCLPWHPPLPGAPRIPRLSYPHRAGLTDYCSHRCVYWSTCMCACL